MKTNARFVLEVMLFMLIGFSGCIARSIPSAKSVEVYTSKKLRITRISDHIYVHTSFKQTQDFGNVPCNGMVICNSGEAVVFDTPVDDQGAEELIQWIKDSLHSNIKGVIPTHFHDDCLGGLNAFHAQGITSYAHQLTIELAREHKAVVPQRAFRDSLVLAVGTESVSVVFPGEGHTRDNVVGYYPAEDVLFGGCLVKELNASKGYLGDANVTSWPATVQYVKAYFPKVKVVIPGHGAFGNRQLLDYTIELFKR